MSQGDTLFIGTDDRRAGLDAVARDAFAALGITEHEERFSSNYPPNDHYFAGYAENVVMDIFDLEEIKPGYPYCLSIELPTYRRGRNPVVADVKAVAEVLARAGFRVFVPNGLWYRDEWMGVEWTMRSNKRIEFAPFGRPTRKSEALLLAAHSQRWASCESPHVQFFYSSNEHTLVEPGVTPAQRRKYVQSHNGRFKRHRAFKTLL